MKDEERYNTYILIGFIQRRFSQLSGSLWNDSWRSQSLEPPNQIEQSHFVLQMLVVETQRSITENPLINT